MNVITRRTFLGETLAAGAVSLAGNRAFGFVFEVCCHGEYFDALLPCLFGYLVEMIYATAVQHEVTAVICQSSGHQSSNSTTCSGY